MREIDWDGLGWARISALVDRDKVAHGLTCRKCGDPAEHEFWLAVLGWTPAAFMIEAFPEFYGGTDA